MKKKKRFVTEKLITKQILIKNSLTKTDFKCSGGIVFPQEKTQRHIINAVKTRKQSDIPSRPNEKFILYEGSNSTI